METSILLGKIIGPILVIVSLGALINRAHFEKTITALIEDPVHVFFLGFIALILGSILVRVHNVWTLDWRVIITLIGWISVLRGVWATLMPGAFSGFGQRFLEKRNLITVGLAGNLLIGGVLTYAAYVN